MFCHKAKGIFILNVTEKALWPFRKTNQEGGIVVNHYTQYIGYGQRIECDMVVAEVIKLISYEPFYKTLLAKSITEYQLIYKHGISANILHRIKHGKNITTKTLDTLCFVLDCQVEDIIEYRRE